MTTKKNPTGPRSAASQKVADMRAAEAKRARRNKIGTWVGVGAVIAAIAAGTAFGVMSAEKVDGQGVPTTATESFALPVGDKDAPVAVDVYEDFQCPACKSFEEAVGSALKGMADAGDIKINYHMMAFLGPDSVRATAAAGCAADVDKFDKFHALAYARLGAENSGSFTESNLLAMGKELDLGDEYAQCVKDDTYSELGAKIDAEAAKKGVTGTPTVFVDGKKVEPGSVFQVVDAAVRAAQGTEDGTEPETAPGTEKSTQGPAADTKQ